MSRILFHNQPFPSIESADENGLVAIGGELTTNRLLEAYHKGIFPWYNEDEPVCWWSPNPRCVLFPGALHISKSMQQVIARKEFSFSVNRAFTDVIRQCKTIQRRGEQGTWIQDEMVDAYTELYKLGYVISAEAWSGEKLSGGLYGVRMGNLFFGESMFSRDTNASKFAFINFVQQLHQEGVEMIDCQMHTPHLASMGAVMIPRKEFAGLLKKNISKNSF